MKFRHRSLVVFVFHGLNEIALFSSAAGFFRRDISTLKGEGNASWSEATKNSPPANMAHSDQAPDNTVYEESLVLSTPKAPTTMAPSRRTAYCFLRENFSSMVSRISLSTTMPSATQQKLHDMANRFWNNRTRRPVDSGGRRHDLMSTTRLSGGAEPEPATASRPEGTEAAGGAAVAGDANGIPKSSTTAAFLGNLEHLRKKSLKSLKLPKSITQGNDQVMQRVKEAAKHAQKTSSRVVPSFVTTVSLLYTADKGISVLTLYALALLGASCGFHLFLHFITIGYALGIGLPLSVALYVYNKHTDLPRATFFHSMITVIWSVRMLAFFVWREYISWPALHEKVVEIQRRMNIPFASRLLCWLVYSFFYLAMMSMTWSRLQQGASARWGVVGGVGLLMQIGGLGLETIADLQKNGFKSHNRHAWCNVGLWKWSSHPNYLGEGLFWWGAYLSHGVFHSIPHTVLATIGLIFIMSVLKGSTRSLAIKHMEKYGDQPEFFEFQRTHSIWGPKQWWWWLHGMEHLSEPTVVAFTTTDGNSTGATYTSALEDNTTAPINAL